MEGLEEAANIISSADGIASLMSPALSLGGKFTKKIPTDRKCKVVFRNESSHYTLYKPRFYIHVGQCSEPLPPRILPSSSGEGVFTRPEVAMKGCFGVFTYDLLDVSTKECSKRIAVLYRVPFDRSKKSNQYGVGIFDTSKECNLDLFNEMSKNKDAAFVSGNARETGLHQESDNVTITATMSDCYKPRMKVVLCD
uniref:Uncharacterized protein n=1 Tax=Gasterosteus aculeatus aculeatus TaxID=481459 RepID=A0AAQ4QGD0_GASAC